MKNAICATCGCVESDSKTGYCVNMHDNWLELEDGVDAFMKASAHLGVNVEELVTAIKENKTLDFGFSTIAGG